jgi:hypothetical protein
MENDDTFELPRGEEQTYIVGRNGTGKSQLGAFLVAKRNLKSQPWIILDYKREKIYNGLEHVQYIDFNEIPKHPGLYILHGLPDDDSQSRMEKWLWKAWEGESFGIVADEGYMLPTNRNGAFQALLTTGRSKDIPMITLSQRPVEISRFVPSEASHIVAFDLNHRKDRATLGEYLPDKFFDDGPLPPYHSRWYRVKKNTGHVVKPVPDAETIMDMIDRQLPTKRRWF